MEDAERFVRAALEASFYASPSEPGLTRDELVRLGSSFDKFEGEIGDAIRLLERRASFAWRGERIRPQIDLSKLSDFNYTFESDPRRWEAFEFVFTSLDEAARRFGRDRASVERSVLIEQGIAEGFTRQDMELAISGLLLDEHVEDVDGRVKITLRGSSWARPSVTFRQRQRHESRHPFGDWLTKLLVPVQDIVSRRTDGRPASVEPLGAFGERLDSLGHGSFKTWWALLVGELRTLEPSRNPTALTVLAAALAEAALSFVVARAQREGATLSKNLDASPRNWKFEALAASAKSGQNPILDQQLYERCMRLNALRQRIHAGRLIEDSAALPTPDLRPEEPREAKNTLEALVRCILDWLDRIDKGG